MAEELKPLPKRITNEIRRILEDCRSGKLNHNQEHLHCGTAHCIAGWKEVFDFAKFIKDESILSGNVGSQNRLAFNKFRWSLSEVEGADYGYAQVEWGLTNTEAVELFAATATFPEQFALLERLEKGERIS